MLENTANIRTGPEAMNDLFIAQAMKDGDFWGDNGALAWEWTRLRETKDRYKKDQHEEAGDMIEALSKASKTYYLAALYATDQSGLCHFKELKKKWRWVMRKYCGLIIARWLSHQVMKLAEVNENLSADQLGNRADILSLWRRYDAAGDCLAVALLQNGVPPDAKVELLTQLAIIDWRQTGKIPEQVFVDVERAILGGEVSPDIIVRFLRTKAKILEQVGGSRQLIDKTTIRAAQNRRRL